MAAVFARTSSTATMLLVIGCLAACNLRDPYAGSQVPRDTGSDPADVGVEDAPGADLAEVDAEEPTVDAGDAGEQPDPLDATNFLERFAHKICEAYLRLDFPPDEASYWWASVDDCMRTFEFYLGAAVARVEHDGALGRTTLDVAPAQSTLDAIDAAMHPLDLPPIELETFFTATVELGEPCANEISCMESSEGRVSCFHPDPGACEGTCAIGRMRCGDVACATDEFCAGGVCETLRADGAPCDDDFQCRNRCLVVGADKRCGQLSTGTPCVDNPSDCPQGTFCSDSGICEELAQEGESCTDDRGCAAPHICEGGSCKAIAEGDRCRLNSTCPEGLACLRVNPAVSERACYGPRPNDAPCRRDIDCAEGFCDTASGSICRPRQGVGGSCLNDRGCEDRLKCAYASADALQGECRELTWALTEGEACHRRAGLCGFGLVCAPSDTRSYEGTCQTKPRPALAASCGDALECAEGYCDGSTGVCEEQVADGGSCSASEQCASLYCAGGTCQRLDAVCP